MAKPFQLGRGLDSLIPKKDKATNYWGNTKPLTAATKTSGASISSTGSSSDQVRWLDVATVQANSRQPRHDFDKESIDDLVASVKTHGILQPLIVTESVNGTYELIAGERRLRAAKLAGLTKVPALVRQAKDQERLELALVENIQRQNLNPLEEARAYEQLRDEFGLTQESIARRVGKSRPQVTNTLRLLELPDSIKQALREGRITFGHAKVIMSLDTPAEQEKFFRLITAQGLPVRLAEAKMHSLKGDRRSATVVDSQLKAWQQVLQTALGAKVEIKGSAKHGKIVVEFYSPDELSDLVEKIKKVGE